MAIILETQYPGKVDPSSASYPYGKPRNITIPGDGTGTPWEAALVSDDQGFTQAILVEGGVVPSGSPDTATNSQRLTALKNVMSKQTGQVSTYEFTTVAEMLTGSTISGDTVAFSVGHRMVTYAYNAPVVAYWDVVTSLGGNDFGLSLPEGVFARLVATEGSNVTRKRSVAVEAFGAYRDDDSNADVTTIAFNTAFSWLEALGGGELTVGAGVYHWTMSESPNSFACVLVPPSCTLSGAGMELTTFTRPSAERSTDGVLLANKYYDTTGGYGAAGNIVLQDFEITDGTATPSRSLGDLIGLGHGKDITIRRVKAGNHDQHFVDICSCSGVKIYDCKGVNGAGTVGSASTIQVDAAFGLGIWGLFISVPGGGGTYAEATEDIEIYGNDFDNKTSPVIQLCHAEWSRYNNIIIRDNPRLSAGYSATGGGDVVIELDEARRWSHLKTLKILRNGLQGNHSAAKLINLFSNNDLSTFDDIEIAHNYGMAKGQTGVYNNTTKFQTEGQFFIYVGNSAAFTDTASGRSQNFFDINIHDNNVVLTGTSVNMRPVTMYNCSGWLKNNKVGYSVDARVNQPVILLDTPRGINVSGNETFQSAQSGTVGLLSASLALDKNLDYETDATIHKNKLVGNNVSYNYLQKSNTNWDPSVDDILFSCNKFKGSTPDVANMKEITPTSDGTNGWHQVDLGGTDGWLELSTSLSSLHNNGLTKDSDQTFMKFEMQYASVAAANNFKTACETMHMTSNSGSNLVGTQLVGVNVLTGDFTVRTGVDGVSMSVNGGTFEPAPRTSGALKIWSGI